jgi:cytosine/adenosine deaminase-related metal-dependent hydrolase
MYYSDVKHNFFLVIRTALKIINPDTILSPLHQVRDNAIAFDKTIHAIGPLQELLDTYPDAELIELPQNSLLMPGLVNSHVHLEFSANKTELTYGGFLPWLYSVIEQRDELVNGCSVDCINRAVQDMLKCGITAFGAVSSYGLDLEAAAAAPQKVVFFNELIGSQAQMADALFGDFISRLNASEAIEREGFYPAVAIHSPYSVHPILIKKALQIAKDKGLVTTAHFMESMAEREWLDDSTGDFKPFFNDLLKQNIAVNSAKEFLEIFKGHPTLMTHVVHADEDELKILHRDGHTVIHCPVSNRLLGNGAIDLDALEKHGIRWVCGTDGLSSNYKLDLFEEMKIALFMHSETALAPLASRLLESVTVNAADALGLNCGEIAVGKDADMLVLQLDSKPNEQLPLHLLLQRYPIKKIFIDGQTVKTEE